VLLWIVIWLAAIALAATMDARVATFMNSRGVESFLLHHKALREVLKSPGFFPFTLLVVIPIVIWRHPMRWRAGLFVFLGTLLSGSNQLFKWIAGRTRPFRPMDGSNRLVPFELHPFPPFGTKNLSFPSGHACLAFATAAALGILWPRFRWLFYSLATIVAIERFSENAHWFSDTVAAVGLGIGGVYLVRWMMKLDDRRSDVSLPGNPCI
jgi:membrane-associated phospholipid phosphatase